MHADPHAVLGVAPGSGPQEVRAAFRAIAKRDHPDRPGGDAAAFDRARRAYETLLAREQAPEPPVAEDDGPIRLRFDFSLRLGRRRR
jgi:DnaJ domain